MVLGEALEEGGILEPLGEGRPDVVGEGGGRVLELPALEPGGEDAVVEVEVPLGLHQEGPGHRVEVLEILHEARVQGLLQLHEALR